MFRISVIVFLFALLSLQPVFAQNKPNAPKKGEELNKLDSKGKRQGMWLNKVPARKGEEPYSEFGNYLHGLKTGPWYKINRAGDLVAIENFRKDVFDGEVKYFTGGQVTVIGKYRGLNPDVLVDTIMVEDPVKDIQMLVPIKSEMGSVRHGTWRYYNESTGFLTKVEEYQVDDLIYEEYFDYSKEDSLRMVQRMKNMPDPNKARDNKSARRQHSYLNY